MKKIRVLHIIKSLGRGGAETLLPETLRLHDRSVFEFQYVYFLPWKNQLVERLESQGAIVHCLPARNNLAILASVRALVSLVRAQKIDLVHCHLPWAGFVGRLLFQGWGVPVIYTEHNKQERYHGITRWINRLSFNHQTAAVAVSADVRESIQKNIGPAIPIYEVLNGVNTAFFQREENAGLPVRARLGIPVDAVVVGIVSVFRLQKRLNEWMHVFKAAAEEQENLYGIIVGDGPLRSEVEGELMALGLGGRVFLAGLQTEVKPWYAAMDIFMMTSVFEGLPIALLEAMSMGCAVVSTDAGGIKEVVRHEKDGLVVGVDAWASLGLVLQRVAADPVLRKRLGQAARARVVEAFSLQRMVGELEQLYGEVLSRKHR